MEKEKQVNSVRLKSSSKIRERVIILCHTYLEHILIYFYYQSRPRNLYLFISVYTLQFVILHKFQEKVLFK